MFGRINMNKLIKFTSLLPLVVLTACGNSITYKVALPDRFEGIYQQVINKSHTVNEYFIEKYVEIDNQQLHAIYMYEDEYKYEPVPGSSKASHSIRKCLSLYDLTTEKYKDYLYSEEDQCWKISESPIKFGFIDLMSYFNRSITINKSNIVEETKEYIHFNLKEGSYDNEIKLTNDSHHICIYEKHGARTISNYTYTPTSEIPHLDQIEK